MLNGLPNNSGHVDTPAPRELDDHCNLNRFYVLTPYQTKLFTGMLCDQPLGK